MVADHFTLLNPVDGTEILAHSSSEWSALYDLDFISGTGLRIYDIRRRDGGPDRSPGYQVHFFNDGSLLPGSKRSPGAFPAGRSARYPGELCGNTVCVYEFTDHKGRLSVEQVNKLINAFMALLAIMPVNPLNLIVEYRNPAIRCELIAYGRSDQIAEKVTTYTIEALADESISEVERGLLLATNDDVKELLTKDDVLEAYRRNRVVEQLMKRASSEHPMCFSPLDSFLHPSYAFNLSMGNQLDAILCCADRDRFWAFFNLIHKMGSVPCDLLDMNPKDAAREIEDFGSGADRDTAIFRMKGIAVDNLECLILESAEGFPPPVASDFFEQESMRSLTGEELTRFLSRCDASMTERGMIHLRDNLRAGLLDGRPAHVLPFLTLSEYNRFMDLLELANNRCGLYAQMSPPRIAEARRVVAASLLSMLNVADEDACVEAIMMAMNEVQAGGNYEVFVSQVGTALESYTDTGSDMAFSWFARLSGVGVR